MMYLGYSFCGWIVLGPHHDKVARNAVVPTEPKWHRFFLFFFPFSVSNPGQSDGVPLLSHQRRRHVRHLPEAERKELPGVALQQTLPLLLHLPLHLHGAQPLHRPHHRHLRDHQGRPERNEIPLETFGDF